MKRKLHDRDDDFSVAYPRNTRGRHRDSGRVVPFLLMFLLGGMAALAANYWFVRNSVSSVQPSTTASTIGSSVVPLLNSQGNGRSQSASSNSVTTVVEQVGPSVVRINSSRTVTRQAPEMFDDPFFRRFFGLDGQAPQSKQIVRGLGSGFIISSEGQILTNAHVVDGADQVTVTLKDGRTLQGKVLGEDRLTDLAVVKIQAQNLPAVQLGNSDQLQPGQTAIAIGNPLGLDNTVTSGIISATGRSISDQRVEYLQTDAAINPGNSGGPLLNDRGQVIGINSAIIQGAQGIGFAIPINTAKRIAEQIITKGKVEHSYLGIEMLTLSPEVKQMINSDPRVGLRVEVEQGVLVAKVLPSSPAAKAGIRPGDVIQTIYNRPATDSHVVQQIVDSVPVGSTLPLSVRRGGQVLTLSVRTEALPAQAEPADNNSEEGP